MTSELALDNIHSFLRGINRFYTNFDRRKAANQIIWQEGSTQVIDYTQVANFDLPILFFIPSLINKSYILDLTGETSLVRYFASLGYRTYLVDFTEPTNDELNMGFSDYQQRLNRALDFICEKSPTVTIGYCLGGVFSCALHSSSKANLIGQILIATPWDFSHFNQTFGLNNPLILQNFVSIVNSLDKVSPSLVQWFFSSLDPNKIWNKFTQFSDMQEQPEVDKFITIEQWVNDGISLSRKFALEALSMLHSNELQAEKFFSVNCPTPCLIFSGLDDKIVPPSSSINLYNLLPNKEVMVKRAGHIGLIVSKLAREEIWSKMESWLKKIAE